MSIAGRVCVFVGLLSAALHAANRDALLDQAEQLLRNGDRDAATELLAKAASEPDPTPQSEDRTGFLYAVLGRNADAVAQFERAIQLDANYPPAHYHLGVALWNAEQPDRGLKELQTAVTLDPKNFDYRYRLGSAYLTGGDTDRAVQELEQATALSPANATAWSELSQALQARNDLAGAAHAAGKAAEFDPQNDALRNSYAFLLVETRQADRSIEESEKVLAHNSRDTSALMNIGYANLKKGDFDAAEKAYRQAIDIDRFSAAAHYDLGIALKSKDQLEAARNEFGEAIDLDSTLTEAHYSLGITDWQLGDFAAMTDQMKAAVSARPGYAEAHYMLGIAYKLTGHPDEALAELRESIRLDPTTPGPYNTIGQILRIKGDKQGSEDAFATGLRLARAKDAQLANSLEQGMRGGMAMKPIAGQAPDKNAAPHP